MTRHSNYQHFPDDQYTRNPKGCSMKYQMISERQHIVKCEENPDSGTNILKNPDLRVALKMKIYALIF
jgi:hypothetical protein